MRIQGLMDRIQNYLLGDVPEQSYYYQRILVGARYIAVMNKMSPPCVVICPTSGAAKETPEYPGRNSNPRGMRSIDLVFEAHIWGKDYDSAELLEAAILTACFRAVDGTVAYIDSEDWISGATLTAGELCVATYRVTGFVIPEILLPLTNPIVPDTAVEVTVNGLPSLTSPTSLTDEVVSLPVLVP